MLALARPSVNEDWPLVANQNYRFNRPGSDNNITSRLCTRTKYTYDAIVNLRADATRISTFDAADRLKTVTQGATNVTFVYDGLGRLLKQTVGAAETRYLWCGIAICQQCNSSDTAEKRFNSEGDYVHTGTKKYLTLTDHLGSVRDVIDISSTPTLVGSFDYRPYGSVARSWGTVTTGYTYAGLFAQTKTALLLSTTRAYNPSNGKWLNVDPIREAGGINLTGYIGARPMRAVDPSGLLAFMRPEGELFNIDAPTTFISTSAFPVNQLQVIAPVWQKRINDAWNGQDWILPGTNCHIRINATISINDSKAANQVLLGDTGTSWSNYKGPNGYGEGRWYFTVKEHITGVHHDGGGAVAHEVRHLMGIQIHSSDPNNIMGGFDKRAALGDVLQALGTINKVQYGGRFDFNNGCGCKK